MSEVVEVVIEAGLAVGFIKEDGGVAGAGSGGVVVEHPGGGVDAVEAGAGEGWGAGEDGDVALEG